MKKLIAFAAALLLTFTAAFAQTDRETARQTLSLAMQMVRGELPMDMGEIIVSRAEVVGDEFVFEYQLKEESLTFDDFCENAAGDRVKLLRNLAGGFLSNPFLGSIIKDAELDFRIILSGLKSGERKEILVSHKELIGVSEDEYTTPRQFVEQEVEGVQSQLPSVIADNMIITAIYIDGDSMVYKFETDSGSVLAMSFVDESLFKEMMIGQLGSSTASQSLLKNLVGANMSLECIFYSKDGSSYTLTMSPEDIKSAIPGAEYMF